MGSGPLAGVKVLEFSQIIAGPFCGMHLADMGALVTKFEPIEGEPWRLSLELVPKESRTYISLNRGKRGVAMDMTRPEAQAVIHALVKDADVVIINYRPGVAEQLKIDYATLSAINPSIIYCENTAFGRQGPLSRRGGYDIVVQALTGLMAGEAKLDGDVPTYVYPAIADYATGIQMSNAICAALFAREKTGKGQRIDCTLMGTAIAMQTTQFTWIDAIDNEVIPPMIEELKQARAEMKSFTEQVAVQKKYRPAPAGNIYYRVYQTRDGFVAVGALSMSLRLKVLAATGLQDPRFKPDGSFEVNPEGWEERGPLLVQEAEALFRTRTTGEWIEILEKHGVPAGPLYFIEELFNHPQTVANGLQVELEHPLLGPLKMVGPAFQMSGTPLDAAVPSPMLGEHNDEVLAEAGLTPGQIEQLRAAGVVR
ncbi:MAG: CoA transferase [Dehalococcoidia bacterium]|jgi:crotonobetainyl-CoA:carnitine CoA-transferase CaiB-like acyl-CoA transferase|nr:CoA transferase [Tepidiformaceae bacterium]